MTGNGMHARATFPGHPSPGGIVILIKFTFAPNFRLGILSKATALFQLS